jgi:succinate dehydrogenase / fumarate reductase cytochrome b subunit
MSSFRRVFSSSVGSKLLIGISGLLLFLYLLVHLAGNLLIFAGQDTFNEYSHALISNPLVLPIEIALGAVFLLHVYKTVTMWMRNQHARPAGYQKKTWAGHTSRKSISSTTMIGTGLTLLLFIGVHLQQFRFGAWYEIGQPPIRDLYRTEAEVFASPLWVAVYVFCMVLVGFHLRHGIASAFQSVGADHPVYTRRLLVTGTVIAVLIAVGFAVIPIWVYVTQ